MPSMPGPTPSAAPTGWDAALASGGAGRSRHLPAGRRTRLALSRGPPRGAAAGPRARWHHPLREPPMTSPSTPPSPDTGAGQPLARYAAWRRIGDVVYLSGVIAVDP